MGIYAVVGVVLLVALAVEFGFIPPPTAIILIQIRRGSVHVAKGNLSVNVVDHVISILRDEAVSEGYIAVTSGRSIAFSRRIPASAHQRLRNVLLNHMR